MTAFLAEFTKETKAFLFSLFSAYCLRKIYFNATKMSRLQKYQVWRSYSKQLFYRI